MSSANRDILTDISHLNKSITSNETEGIIVSQQRRAQDQTDSLLNSTRPLKKNSNSPQTIP
jgi:hypothetical protein